MLQKNHWFIEFDLIQLINCLSFVLTTNFHGPEFENDLFYV